MAMAFFVLFLLACCISMSSATVFKVGDGVGWTISKIDYGTWASNKTFHVGDTLLFEYNSTYHNVLEVTKPSYDSCITKSPTSTHKTGNDSIVIKSGGDHFFLCGVPGHCSLGQKLKVSVLAKGASAAPSSSPTAAPVPSGSPGSSGRPVTPSTAGATPGTPAAAPANSHASTLSCAGLSFLVFIASVAAVYFV